jgi:superfamily II DNA or RNA helicase
MALTIYGYRIAKKDVPNLAQTKGILTVRPYIPSVFVKPQYVTKYPVYKESPEYIYVPKHYGIQEFGPPSASTRNVPETDGQYWKFAGAIRPAQQPVVDSFLKPEPHDGILSLQTGGGKTVCALYIASQLRLPTLVLVHSTFLRDQWIERIQSFLPNARIGSVQGDKVDIADKDVVVGMLQTISMKDLPNDTFKPIGLVIVDECHHIASEAFSQAIPKVTSKYMLGLSATPERKDKLMHVINWCLGPMLYRSNALDKVDEGVRVQVVEFDTDDVKFNEIIYNNSGVMFTSLMTNKLVAFEPRNRLLAQLIGNIYEEKTRQVLVLTDRVEHTKAIFELLPEFIQKETGILASGMKPAVRDEFCANKRVLISTYQLVKEGFDVPSLNTLVMATPRPDIEQIVGRILRVEKSKRTTQPLIVDVVDGPFRRQFQARNTLYKARNYDQSMNKYFF